MPSIAGAITRPVSRAGSGSVSRAIPGAIVVPAGARGRIIPVIVVVVVAVRSPSTPRGVRRRMIVGVVVDDDLSGPSTSREAVGTADARSGLRYQHAAAIGVVHRLASSLSPYAVVHHDWHGVIVHVKPLPRHAGEGRVSSRRSVCHECKTKYRGDGFPSSAPDET